MNRRGLLPCDSPGAGDLNESHRHPLDFPPFLDSVTLTGLAQLRVHRIANTGDGWRPLTSVVVEATEEKRARDATRIDYDSSTVRVVLST